LLVSGGPHNPWLPLKESASNDWIWVPEGIFPTRWLNERFIYSRKFRLESSWGICPFKELFDKSMDSRFFKFPTYDGIWPMNALCDKFCALCQLTLVVYSTQIIPSEIQLKIIFYASNSRRNSGWILMLIKEKNIILCYT
jgi:hypothetical protein